MALFTGYMPMQGSDLGSRATNERRLIANWKAYVDAAQARHQPAMRRDD
jgi:hypothetical protein